MSTTPLDLLAISTLELPSSLSRKTRASDQEGAREVLRALNRSRQDRKLTRADRVQLAELLEALEQRTKILARVRALQTREDVISPDLILRIFWYRVLWVRSPKSFRRTSHNPYVQLKAFVRHLFERYPTPSFLLNSFLKQNRDSNYYVGIAQGANIRQYEDFRPRLTKTQAHLFHHLEVEELSLKQAALLAMCRSYGVANPVARVLIRNRHVRDGHHAFWATFMEFLSRQERVNPSVIDPLCDFLHQHRVLPREAPGQPARQFSFKGRTFASLLERMNAWHAELAQEEEIHGHSWTPASYFTQLPLDENNHGWQIYEITTEKDLRREGARLRHCVYSYLQSCLNKRSRIFSLQRLSKTYPYGQSVLTLELRPVKGKQPRYELYQVRGKCNRDPTEEEDEVLQAWAKENLILADDYKWELYNLR